MTPKKFNIDEDDCAFRTLELDLLIPAIVFPVTFDSDEDIRRLGLDVPDLCVSPGDRLNDVI